MSALITKNTRKKNQRVSNSRQRRQQHLLDVTVRSHTATKHRNRRVLVICSKVMLSLLACAALGVGAWVGAKQLFFENPDYRLSRIEVQTDGTLQREQVLNAAEVREGVNIFRVNLSALQEHLQQLPQVDEVQVVRKMPSEIDISIIERKPVAWITSDKSLSDPFASDAAFLIDGRGVLMKQKKLLPEYLGLPLITGCTSETLDAGKTVDSFEAKTALELLRLSTRSFMQTRFQIREIDLSKGYCLVVSDKNHTQVTFGFDDLETQLQRLEQFLVYADDSKRELETVNLLVQRNIPVTFARPASEIINETVDLNEPPRIMKALPVNQPPPKAVLATAPPPKAVPVAKGKAGPQPFSMDHGAPAHKGKRN